MMKQQVFQPGERGTSTLELTLCLPLLVFVMMFLIGLGHALITRQHAVVAARFAATYHGVMGRKPNESLVSEAASDGQEAWRLSGRDANAGSEAEQGLGGGVASIISSAFGAFTGGAGSGGRIDYVAGTTPQRGILPRLFSLGEAQAQSQIIAGSWTCADGQASFLPQVLSRVNPLNLLGARCCQCYETKGIK